MRTASYSHGNQLSLLHQGEQFFPALISACDRALSEIYIETYIFSLDPTGLRVKAALLRAVRRGVAVQLVVDWLGTGDDTIAQLRAELEPAGVRLLVFNPWFQRGIVRMHRKIAVIDQRIAFLGGLNINDDWITDDGSAEPLPAARWDFAVSVSGPLVQTIHAEVLAQWQRLGPRPLRTRLESFRQYVSSRQAWRAVEVAEAAFVVRDNLRNRKAIQRALLQALGRARSSALLVTPYFAPGRKLRKAMVHAAQRGVEVVLLIGVGQFAMQDAVAQSFYPRLVRAGVRIVEYRRTQLHGKLAVIDGEWATVGSSNFDGLSLFVNHEANIVVRDVGFAASLQGMIRAAVAEGVTITDDDVARLSLPRRLWNRFAYGLYRVVLQALTLGSYTR
ncbi:MAG: phospholipase D-like domain-containing protein [Oxalobacteraceae bacterium]|nr:phospholipase D-like domain-containing protein [Oxalobacteraceae bacterium]